MWLQQQAPFYLSFQSGAGAHHLLHQYPSEGDQGISDVITQLALMTLSSKADFLRMRKSFNPLENIFLKKYVLGTTYIVMCERSIEMLTYTQ